MYKRQVLKRYVANVHGVLAEAEGVIELPIAKRQHRPPLYGVDPAGKPCITRWRLLETMPPTSSKPAWSRLELQPITGRSHQLRVHLEAIGHPIVGDQLYGKEPEINTCTTSDRMHLHATELQFRTTGGKVWRFICGVPF